MRGTAIPLPDKAAAISVRPAPLRITYPRLGKMVLGVLALLGGLVIWGGLLPEGAWQEPFEYGLGLLLMAPGACGVAWAMRRRPVLEATETEFVVRCGPAFFERPVVRLPLETLEVRVDVGTTLAVRYDSHAVSRRLLAAMNPLVSGKLPASEVKRYVLQVRSRGQQEWLSVLGSQVASEVENARLAVAAVVRGAAEGEEVRVETVDDDAGDEPPGRVSRSPGSS